MICRRRGEAEASTKDIVISDYAPGPLRIRYVPSAETYPAVAPNVDGKRDVDGKAHQDPVPVSPGRTRHTRCGSPGAAREHQGRPAGNLHAVGQAQAHQAVEPALAADPLFCP